MCWHLVFLREYIILLYSHLSIWIVFHLIVIHQKFSVKSVLPSIKLIIIHVYFKTNLSDLLNCFLVSFYERNFKTKMYPSYSYISHTYASSMENPIQTIENCYVNVYKGPYCPLFSLNYNYFVVSSSHFTYFPC